MNSEEIHSYRDYAMDEKRPLKILEIKGQKDIRKIIAEPMES